MNQRVIVSLGILGVFLSIFLGSISIIPWQVSGVLVAVCIGIPTLLLHYERGKSNTSISHGKPARSNEEKRAPKAATGSPLLPDTTEVTKLEMDDVLLDKIYEQARSEAVKTYDDAGLSSFSIQVYPFESGRPSVYIYFVFYSKWANKICDFQYSDLTSSLKHYTPDKRAKTDVYRRVFSTLPWKTSPQFLRALKLAYDKIKPLPSVKGTSYLFFRLASQDHWSLKFEDGTSGEEYSFSWNGQGLDENSIRQEG
jgi:hypothetical protein